jgi:hypothetical protein
VSDRLSAWVGPDERDQQAAKPVREHADSPEFQRDAQARPLLVVEMDGPARSDRLEPLNDRFALGDGFELLEQNVSLVPGDLDDLSRDIDSHAIESVRHTMESRTS